MDSVGSFAVAPWIVRLRRKYLAFGIQIALVAMIASVVIVANAGSDDEGKAISGVTTSTPSSDESAILAEAIRDVERSLRPNPFDAVGSPPYEEIRALSNPWGEGALVFLPEFEHAFGTAHAVWFVLDGLVYAVNGTAVEMAPDLSFLRDAAAGVRQRAGLPTLNTEIFDYIYH